MTIPCSLYPLGTMISPYKIDEVICDIRDGQTATVRMYPGVYYIRAQGAGGGGGRNGYFGNGQGGGSGAGFEGYVYLKVDYGDMVMTAGVGGAEAYHGNPGTNTVIGQLMTLGAGGGGAGETTEHYANAGILTINPTNNWEIISSTVSQNGQQGLEATSSGDFVSGGNSVLTNSGGGKGHAPATAPGAGGGGGYQWNIEGGNGGCGECLIKFVRIY